MIGIGIAVSGVGGVSPAQASVSSDFNPGRIITDDLFYAGSSMSAGQIQTFLAQRLAETSDGRCTIGDPGRKAGSPWKSTYIASSCLKDARFTTPSRAANAYCKAYVGAANETVGAIIAKVGKACGISPKVLLVMLEKEQSLVSDTWPTTRQYEFAMGYDCPDSGPNNSANCSSGSGGFSAQMYRAAWQLKVYRAHPDAYNYRPFRANTIKWAPDDKNRNPVDCGTSSVYIENWATASLYIYTPYRPNQASLNAGWGTGNSCSSYGNRNFHNFYKSWFGSVQGEATSTMKVRERYAANPGKFGTPLTAAPEAIAANGGGSQWRFSKGIITYSNSLKRVHDSTGTGSFLSAYIAQGAAKGSWGFLASDGPTGEVAAGTRAQAFQQGTAIYADAKIGVKFVPTRLHTAWVAAGRHKGALGFPTGNASLPTTTSGSQKFQKATLMVSGSNSAVVTPAQLTRWNAIGGRATVGYFTGPEIVIGAQTSRFTEKGLVHFLNATEHVYLANGEYLTAYTKAGGPKGSWGTLVAGKKTLQDGNTAVVFTGGMAVHSARTGVIFYPGKSSSTTAPTPSEQLKHATPTPDGARPPATSSPDAPAPEAPETSEIPNQTEVPEPPGTDHPEENESGSVSGADSDGEAAERASPTDGTFEAKNHAAD